MSEKFDKNNFIAPQCDPIEDASEPALNLSTRAVMEEPHNPPAPWLSNDHMTYARNISPTQAFGVDLPEKKYPTYDRVPLNTADPRAKALPRRKNFLAAAGFLVSLISVAYGYPLSAAGLLGLILSIKAYRKACTCEFDGRKRSIAGMILGSLALIWFILAYFSWVQFGGFFS